MSDATGVRVYACGVAWQVEMGDTDVLVYRSPEAVVTHRGCAEECGVVELEVRLVRWVRLPTLEVRP